MHTIRLMASFFVVLMLLIDADRNCAGAASSAPEANPLDTRPNVILLITDDQGYGDLGVHGNPVIHTPNLDRLAGESIRLDDYHVAPTCSPTRAALLTGHWQNRTGVWYTVMGRSLLRANEITLADMLADAGYETAMVGKWHLGDNYPFRPHDRGFQRAYYHGGGGVGQTPDYWDNAYFDGHYYRNGLPEPAEGYVTDVFFSEAIAYIDEMHQAGNPFFLYLSTNAPHGPMHAPQHYADQYADTGLSTAEQHFFGMITNIDDNVARLLEHLQRTGLANNTIFIFTTDNGTSTGHEVFNAGMRGKKGSEYDGGHRVPLFLRWPAGGLDESRTVDRLTANVDIVPTLLDLAGVPAPQGVTFDGASIRPLLEGHAPDWPDRTLVTDSQRVLDPIKWRRATVMTDRWRMINGEELYDMDIDPSQQQDVSEDYPEVFGRLRAHYERWWAELLPGFKETSAIVLGHDAANPATLTAHDWLGANAQIPWNQRHIRKLEHEADGHHKNYWWVDVAVAGTYRFELRRWPKESGLPITAAAEPGEPVPGTQAFRLAKGQPFSAESARLAVGDQVLESGVDEHALRVSFTVRLDAGPRRLSAMFIDAAGRQLGAYYLTVTRLYFEPTWDSLAAASVPRWWDEGKFGIFIHWGPYSVAGYRYQNQGYAEAITKDLYKRPELYSDFMTEKFGAIPPDFGYKDMVPLFKAENWDPKAWAELFRKSGARYVIPTGEHHDGFVLWDSTLTPWTATRKGPMRDLIGDLAAAVRAEGLKFGISYHRERHPGRFAPEDVVHGQPHDLIAQEILRMPEAASLYGPFEYSDEFIADYVDRWKEAEQNYQPDFMWLDDIPIFRQGAGDPQVIKFERAIRQMIADYLNTAKQWGKAVFFNNKGKVPNWPEAVGVLEADNMNIETIGPRWQNPATLGTSYAYMTAEEEGDLYKSPTELVHLLYDVVSKNGNLLLNIGPRADGIIPQGMQDRLLAIGEWLDVHGEAIYGSRPWLTFGEHSGEPIERAGVRYTRHSMREHDMEFRFTSKPGVVYVIAFQPQEAPVLLKSFAGLDYSISDVSLLGSEAKIGWSQQPAGLRIEAGSILPFSHAAVFKVTFDQAGTTGPRETRSEIQHDDRNE